MMRKIELYRGGDRWSCLCGDFQFCEGAFDRLFFLDWTIKKVLLTMDAVAFDGCEAVTLVLDGWVHTMIRGERYDLYELTGDELYKIACLTKTENVRRLFVKVEVI